MSKNWKIKDNEINIPEIGSADNYDPIILKLLAGRNITGESEVKSFFEFDYGKLSDPSALLDMEKAVSRIIEAKDRDEKIAIYGDYDADGVTATALLHETLLNLGFQKIIYYIPDRQLEGYGMNEKSIDYLAGENVKLIITVDCGVSNVVEIEKAKKLGMDVIITDHHQILKDVPDALAVINPNLENSGFAFKDLAGVGVAFKLAQALYLKIKPSDMEQLKWMLDLVCIGTVADCVRLTGENRMLVKFGLIVLSKTKRLGLQEMFKVGRIEISEDSVPDTQKVAFQIAPRINAAGRMDHASVAYKLIIEKDRVMARDMALEVESKNQQRQKMTKQIVEEIRGIALELFKDKSLIIAESPHWPVGILGLVAGKIAEEFGKPTIVLQEQDGLYVGSLRSIDEINIAEALKVCSGLLLKFGGHSQAAGVRLDPEKRDEFFAKLSSIVEKQMQGITPAVNVDIDTEIFAEDINWELINWLKKMEPYGEGNGEPVFLMKNLVISEAKIVGNGTKHLKLFLRPESGSPKVFDSIGFGMGGEFSDLKPGDRVNIVFNLREDGWNGSKKIQLRLIDLKLISE